MWKEANSHANTGGNTGMVPRAVELWGNSQSVTGVWNQEQVKHSQGGMPQKVRGRLLPQITHNVKQGCRQPPKRCTRSTPALTWRQPVTSIQKGPPGQNKPWPLQLTVDVTAEWLTFPAQLNQIARRALLDGTPLTDIHSPLLHNGTKFAFVMD